MKVTRDMVDKDLRGRYAAGRIIAGFLHTKWFSLLVLRFRRDERYALRSCGTLHRLYEIATQAPCPLP
jgi:hypothetical protein